MITFLTAAGLHALVSHPKNFCEVWEDPMDADVLVIGAGLAGLVAAAEAADRGLSVIILDQEGEQSLGGQAFWSLGGLFFVDSPEQRLMGIKDNLGLGRQDWLGSAQFDRPEDHWPRQWAEAYLDFAAGEKRRWLHEQGMRWFPVVGWAERGGSLASGHGNSVPRFHVTWGTGPGVLAPFIRRVRAHEANGKISFRFRHRVDELLVSNGAVTGARGSILKADPVERGQKSGREITGAFEITAGATLVSSGGIGGNHDLVRRNWPVERLGPAPRFMVAGVPDHVDGRMLGIAEQAGAGIINSDRMWHYTEGLRNWAPIWPNHGIRILPGPSSLWFDAKGNRFEAPAMPGFDTLATLKSILSTGHDYSWFILTKAIIKKEFALSGSEQNPDLTGKDIPLLLKRLGKEPPRPVKAFMDKGEDFVVRNTIEELVAAMNALTGENLLDPGHVKAQIEARDRELDNAFSKDAQITAIRGARAYRGDKLMRTAKPHRILDPKAGPLVAVRLSILTRKTLGGLHTDLQSRVLGPDGNPVPGLYAAGEAAGFGGGGVHGYNALEGTFLGGCIFSGRIAGRSMGG
jgi:predicted oxidoreductase